MELKLFLIENENCQKDTCSHPKGNEIQEVIAGKNILHVYWRRCVLFMLFLQVK